MLALRLQFLLRRRRGTAKRWRRPSGYADAAGMSANHRAGRAKQTRLAYPQEPAGTMVTLSPQPQASVSLGLWKTNFDDSLVVS